MQVYNRLITYTDFDSYKIFEDYYKVNLDILLSDIPKSFLIQFTSNLSYRFLYREGDFEIDNDTFISIFQFDINFLIVMSDILNKLRKVEKVATTIFTPMANLKIQNYSILREHDFSRKEQPQDYLKIFKAFLYLNELENEKHNSLMSSYKHLDNNTRFRYYTLAINFSQYEFVNSDKRDPIAQLIKAILFFKYLEKSKMDEIIQLYVINNGHLSWQSYLKNIGSIFLKQASLDKYVSIKNAKPIINIKKSLQIEIGFLDRISIYKRDADKYDIDDNDFKVLRDYPILRLTDTMFIFLNLKFFSDKVFNSILFNVYKIFNTNFYNGELTLPVFKERYYSKKFIEQFLLKYLLFECFRDKYNVYKSNQTSKFECSDYYMIDSFNNLVLFECKDILVPASVKYSLSPERILEYLNERFEKESGINQFIKVIKKINEDKSGEKDIEQLLKNNTSINVYPIIIYTDKTLDCPTLNSYLDSQLSKKLINLSVNKIEVKNLILIHIDTFISNMGILKDCNFDFISFLDEYGNYLKNDGFEQFDFNFHLDQKVNKPEYDHIIRYPHLIKDFWRDDDVRVDL